MMYVHGLEKVMKKGCIVNLNSGFMRKGLNATITLIIAIVVMVIVALALIAVTTGNLGNFGKDTNSKVEAGMGELDQNSEYMKKIKCKSTFTDTGSVCSGISSNCGYKPSLKKCYWIPDSDNYEYI